MSPISGTFVADFESFKSACDAATTKLVSFESASTKVASALGRLETSFSGKKIIQDATLMSEAVERVGGLSKLTAAELARVASQAGEAAEKMRALGIAGAEDMQKLADAARPIPPRLRELGEASGTAAPKVGGLAGSLKTVDGMLGAVGIHIGPEIKALEDLGSASGKSASQIGLVGTAGLALGAGMAGWQIGRMIAQLFDLDAAIAKVAGSLLDLGNVKAAEAGAKADVLALASARAGRAITTMAEAMKVNQQWVDDFNLKIGRSKDAAGESADAVDRWRKEIAGVKADGNLEALTANLNSQNFSLDALSKRYGIHVEALQYLTREQKRAAELTAAQVEAIAKAQKKQDEWIESTGKLADAIKAFGEDTLARSNELIRGNAAINAEASKVIITAKLAEIEAENKLNAAYGVTRSGYAVQGTAVDTLAGKLAALDAAMAPGVSTNARRTVAMNEYTTALQKAALEEDATAAAAARAGTEAEKLPAAVKPAADGMLSLGANAQQAASGLFSMSVELYNAIRAAQASDALTNVIPIYGASGLIGMRSPSGRASGGPVSAGTPYVVGEQGPELFVPAATGTIVPSLRLGAAGGGGTVIQNTFHIVDTESGIARRVSEHLTRSILQGQKFS